MAGTLRRKTDRDPDQLELDGRADGGPAHCSIWHRDGGGPLFPLVATAASARSSAPALLGSAVTLTLVNVFPARRTRDILSVVAVLSGAGLVVLLRLLRPERLARPEGFQTFTSYLAALQAPSAPWLPSEWTAHAMIGMAHA